MATPPGQKNQATTVPSGTLGDCSPAQYRSTAESDSDPRRFPRVLAAVLNYNGRNHLESLLPTLVRQDYPNLEITVVDNASSDDSVPWLQRNFPSVGVIQLEENVGYSALNLALKHARQGGAEYVLLLTNDLRLDSRCVSHAVEAATADHSIGIIGFEMLGALRWVDPGALDEASANLKDTELQEREWIEGAAMFCRQSMLDLLGGIDAKYFVYADEDDLQYRARAAGFRLVGLNTPVWHNAGRNVLATATRTSAYLQMRNLIRFRLKSYGYWMGLKTAAWVGMNACKPGRAPDRTMPFEVRLRPFGPLENLPIVLQAVSWNLLNLPETWAARRRDQRRINAARGLLSNDGE